MAQTVKITPALGTLEFIGNTSLAASTSAIFTGDTAGSIALAFPAAQGIEITGFVTVIGNITATSFIKSGGTAAQFLKADGSVDSAVYALASRTLTINNVSYDLTADRSWTISTADGYISDVQLTGNELRFTGEGSAFSGSIDLSSIIPTEQDTLDSVTDRGNVTTNTIDVGGAKSDYFLLDTAASPTQAAGMFYWNDRDDTANLRLSDGVDLRLGQDLVWYVKAGVEITKGQVVMSAGTDATSGHIIAAPMIADGSVEERYVLGIATKSVTAGEFTHVVAFGKVYKLGILTGFQAGSVLFCDPSVPGGLTDVQPTAPELSIPIAFVVNNQQNNGVLAVRVLPGYHLGELHDVKLDSEATGQLLRYNVNRWENWTPNYATTTYVDTSISNLIDLAPDALNTLNELAAALGDDPNFATTITTAISGKVAKAGDTMTGDLQVNAKIGTRDETGGFYLRGTGDITHKIYYSTTENANVWEYNAPIKFRYYNDGTPVTRFTLTEAGNLSISGTFSASGYNDSNWNAAYNDKINSASFNITNGILTLTQQDGGTVTVDLDGKYSEIGHTHALSVNDSGLINIAGSEASIYSIDSRDRRALVDLPNTFDRGLYLDFKNPQIFPELTADGYKGQMLWRAYGDASDMSGGYPIQIVYDQAGDIHYRLGVSASAWADQFSTVASQQWVAAQAYLTTESDPTVPSHVKSITTTNISNWNAAYNDKVNSASFNTADGILTLTQQDGGTVTVDLDGRYLTSETDSQTLSWDLPSQTLSISNGNSVDLRDLATQDFVTSQGYLTAETDPYRITNATVTGTATKTLTITRADSTTVTATWTDYDTDTNTYVTSATFNTSTGVLTLTRNDSGTVTVDLDDRYLTSYENNYISAVALNESILRFTGEGSGFNGDIDLSALGYLTSYTETDTLATVTARGASTPHDIGIGATTGGNRGLGIYYGTDVNDYGRIRFYQNNSNHNTIHSFAYNWQSGTILNASSGAINITGQTGVTFGSWNEIDAAIVVGGQSYFRGNMGIGTLSPEAKLHVAGGDVLISNGQYYTAESSTGGNFKLAGLTSGNVIVVGAIDYASAATIFAGGDNVNFTTGGVAGDVRIKITSSGNVGLHTLYPQKKLDVVGPAGIIASFGANIGVGQIAGFHFGYSESMLNNDLYKKSALVFERTDGYTGQGGNAGGKIHFLLNNSGSSSATSLAHSVLTIDSNSTGAQGSIRMGVGTKTPTATLTVNGTTAGESLLEVYGTNGLLFAVNDDLSNSLFSANTIAGLPVIEAFADGSVVMGPFATPVTVTTTGQINTT
jgi:hypothetical protein